MNKKKKTVLLGVFAGITLAATAIFTAEAVSDDDPLITLSYLEKVVLPSLKGDVKEEITNDIKNEIKQELKEELSDEIASETFFVSDSGENANASFSEYELIELSYGQSVTANSICEFIARPGSYVTVISPFETQGIADITHSVELCDSDEVPMNAYCIIPRGDDGRGFTVQSQKAFIMIRGDYTIG